VRSAGSFTQGLPCGHGLHPGQNRLDRQRRCRRQGPDVLEQIVYKLLAADAAARLAEIMAAIQDAGDQPSAFGREGHRDDVRRLPLAERDRAGIRNRIDDAFGQAESGRMRDLVPGGAHHDRIGLAVHPDRERLLAQKFHAPGGSPSVFPERHGRRGRTVQVNVSCEVVGSLRPKPPQFKLGLNAAPPPPRAPQERGACGRPEWITAGPASEKGCNPVLSHFC